MDIKQVYEAMMRKSYYSAKDLKYNKDPGFFLSPLEYSELLEYFDEEAKRNKSIVALKLKPFNDFAPRISFSDELVSLMKDYLTLIKEDENENKAFLSSRNMEAITKSRIFSEIEGTLNIESVPTTRKLLHDLLINKKAPVNENEQIIHNMANAIEYVNTCPKFSKENLFKLYSILSDGCLNEENKLLPGHLYRHDQVEVDRYLGCPEEMVESAMDSLFDFVNSKLDDSVMRILLPHIAHYYILYIHPYFDYNGRTARMVSYWINVLLDQDFMPPVISEAINQTKNAYYASLRETRDSHNDITYFLLYIYKVSINYFLTYKNVEWIEQEMKNKSIVLTETNKAYIKKILISSKGKFTFEDFIKYSNSEMSKQAAFKILNEFESIGFLKSETGKSHKKLFQVNDEMVRYRGISL